MAALSPLNIESMFTLHHTYALTPTAPVALGVEQHQAAHDVLALGHKVHDALRGDGGPGELRLEVLVAGPLVGPLERPMHAGHQLLPKVYDHLRVWVCRVKRVFLCNIR